MGKVEWAIENLGVGIRKGNNGILIRNKKLEIIRTSTSYL
jgi:hypothetical protein